MKARRFPNWNPKVGERALITGNPASAQYVDTLTQADVAAIKNSHRGYAPLILDLWYDGEIFDRICYNEKRRVWESGRGGSCKTLSSALGLAGAYCGSNLTGKKVTADVARR